MGEKPERDTVLSADGTRIGFTRVGSGPVPLVIVHGALSFGQNWVRVAMALAEHCTCYVMDRWGRGESGSHGDYSLEREVEDVSAVLGLAGPDAFLLGHSSGAVYALEAALRAPVAGLILYEPPLHGFQGRFVEDIWDRIRVAADEERFDDVVALFLSEEAELPDDVLSSLRATPLWQQMVALAPHSVREWAELIRVAPNVDRYRNHSVPTLLLAGTETEDHPSFATRALGSTLPDARRAMLDGQGHTAHLAAPELVARVTVAFLLDAARQRTR